MEVMYVKYINGRRHSIIKEGENIVVKDSKIIPFKPVEKIEKNTLSSYLDNQNSNITSKSYDNTDEKITEFFFDAIHKNHLSNRRK